MKITDLLVHLHPTAAAHAKGMGMAVDLLTTKKEDFCVEAAFNVRGQFAIDPGTTGCCDGGGGASLPGFVFKVNDPPYVVINPYAPLKEFLATALKKEEDREKALEESLNLQSLTEVEALEAKLNEALAELRVLKAGLKQKSDGK